MLTFVQFVVAIVVGNLLTIGLIIAVATVFDWCESTSGCEWNERL